MGKVIRRSDIISLTWVGTLVMPMKPLLLIAYPIHNVTYYTKIYSNVNSIIGNSTSIWSLMLPYMITIFIFYFQKLT